MSPFVLVGLSAAPAAADRAFEAFFAELERPGPEFVVVSNHFRHDVGCTSRGCVVMGPTDDQAACEAWSRAYNTIDPYDHTRCVQAAAEP